MKQQSRLTRLEPRPQRSASKKLTCLVQLNERAGSQKNPCRHKQASCAISKERENRSRCEREQSHSSADLDCCAIPLKSALNPHADAVHGTKKNQHTGNSQGNQALGRR